MQPQLPGAYFDVHGNYSPTMTGTYNPVIARLQHLEGPYVGAKGLGFRV